MELIQPLMAGPLDIVGDVHGEYDALCRLLQELGYDSTGHHPAGRHLVFVGDLCDRGPKSPDVFHRVMRMVYLGTAQCIVGNHELNLVNDDAKPGAGWFFPEQAKRDDRYAPFATASAEERTAIRDFADHQPLALERGDLRIVHAVWHELAIAQARSMDAASVHGAHAACRSAAGNDEHLKRVAAEEKAAWAHPLDNKNHIPPMLDAEAEREVWSQMGNPIKVLTSGVERKAKAPFFTSGKWRFAERVAWWDRYTDDIPVVVGHYWRKVQPMDTQKLGKGGANLFDGIAPFAWMGRGRNVFCTDYSVGGRYLLREQQKQARAGKGDGKTDSPDCFKLGALRWPERELVFADGSRHATEGFGKP